MGLRGKMIGVFFIGFSLLALPALLIASTTLIPQRFWELVALIVLLLVWTVATLYFSVKGLILQRARKLDRDLGIIWRNGRWAERLVVSKAADEQDQFNILSTSINQLLALIRKQSLMLESITLLDNLTQIANRHAFDDRIVIELSQHQRNHTPLSLLIINVDEFDRYLDYYGSTAADEVLRNVGQLLSQVACRPADLSARILNEQFALILPATNLEGACHIADILSARLAEQNILHADSEVAERITLSIGIASASALDDGPLFIQRAEKAGHNARQRGGDTSSYLQAD